MTLLCNFKMLLFILEIALFCLNRPNHQRSTGIHAQMDWIATAIAGGGGGDTGDETRLHLFIFSP